MQKMNEQILSSWLMMIMAIDSERIASKLSYNEAIVCNLLYSNADIEMTATDLCAITKMQKSLMNRTLTSLEMKGLIERTRSLLDKRSIIVRLIHDENSLFMIQHQETLNYIDKITAQLSEEEKRDVTRIFHLVANLAQKENQ